MQKVLRCGLIVVLVMSVITIIAFPPWSRFFWTKSIDVSGEVLRPNGHPATGATIIVDILYFNKAGRCIGVSRGLRSQTSGSGGWAVHDRVAPKADTVEVYVVDVLGEKVLNPNRPLGDKVLTLPAGASDLHFTRQGHEAGVRQDCVASFGHLMVRVEER
jgi:hypothetical protein